MPLPLTAAQRQANRRKKLKEDQNYEDYKRKDALRKRLKRAESKQNETELSVNEQRVLQEKLRRETRARVSKHRASKKARNGVPASPHTPPFKSAQSLGRAVSRARRALSPALPSTPKRKHAVWQKLINKYGDTTSSAENTPIRSIAIAKETKDLVRNFYERDDISRQAPGRKDVVTIRSENGGKTKLQARHLTTTINEVYAMFKESNPDIKIGRSKFSELRPKHVLLSSQLPRNVCLCKYHENFIMAVNTLNKEFGHIPKYDHDLPAKLVCAAATDDCWFNRCPTCSDAKLARGIFLLEESKAATWYVWGKDGDDKLCKMVKEGTTDDLFDHLCSILPEFLQHCHVKRNQADSYNKEREAVGCEEFDKSFALLQVDFSENYTCMFQDEIQSAHWKQDQVSLFTAALWFDGKLHPTVIASDDLNHGKETVVSYIDHLLDTLPATVKCISIWSDGPSLQFKNRFVVAAISSLQEKHKINIIWNYFATSHGKGPVDGIGGSVKRQVWMDVSNRKSMVTDATSFCATAKQVSNVDVVEMKTDEIKERNANLQLKEVFDDAPLVKGIKSFHHIKIIDSVSHGYAMTKDAKNDPDKSADEFVVSDWCVVEYDNQLFPGEIQTVVGEKYEVSAMIKAGRFWKWPAQEDRILYLRDQIVKGLNPPILVNAR